MSASGPSTAVYIRTPVIACALFSMGCERPTSPSTGNRIVIGITNWLLRRVAEKTVVMLISATLSFGEPAARHCFITSAAGSRTCWSCVPATGSATSGMGMPAFSSKSASRTFSSAADAKAATSSSKSDRMTTTDSL